MSTNPDYDAMYVVRSVSDDGMAYATPYDPTQVRVAVMAGLDSCWGFDLIADVSVQFRMTRPGAYLAPGQVIKVQPYGPPPTVFPSLADQ